MIIVLSLGYLGLIETDAIRLNRKEIPFNNESTPLRLLSCVRRPGLIRNGVLNSGPFECL